MKKTVIQRFEEKFVPEPNTGCWLWIRRCNKAGYGKFSINSNPVYAHRFSFEMYKHKIPNTGNKLDTCICHTCDTPSCVNPNHLFLGTHRENMRDAIQKNRKGYKGEKHFGHRLTDIQVLLIRRDSRTLKEIAKDYNIHFGTVHSIKKIKTWKHL